MDEGNEHHTADLDGSRDGEVSLATARRHDVTGDLDATSHDASRHGALVPEDVVERMEAAEDEDEDDEIVINVKAAEGDVSLNNEKEQVSPSADKSPVDKNKENLMGPPTKRTPIATPKAAMVTKDATPRLANLRVKVGPPAQQHHGILKNKMDGRADSRLAPSQWETLLQSNAVSHWLGTNLELALDGLGQNFDNYGVLAMELPQSCAKPSKLTTEFFFLTHWGRVTHNV